MNSANANTFAGANANINMNAGANANADANSNASASTNTAYRALWNGKQAQDAQTPPALRKMLDELYFGGAKVFDPCPVNPSFDGLRVAWKARNYVNPPFGDVQQWIKKAAGEVDEGRKCGAARATVLLMPARLGTNYFKQALSCPKLHSIVLWTNRVQFVPFKAALNVPIMTLLFGSCQRRSGSLHAVDLDFCDQTVQSVRSFANRKYAGAKVMNGLNYSCPSVSALVQRAADSCKRARELFYIALLSVDCFTTSYFKEAVPFVRSISLVYPRHPKFIASSCIVCFSGNRINAPRIHRGRLPRFYLGTQDASVFK